VALQDLKTLRSLLRSRIGEPSEVKFTNVELNTIISAGQFDVARRLLKINKSWLADNTNINITSGVATLPTDCGDIEAVVSSDMVNYGSFKELPLSSAGLHENIFHQLRNMNNSGYFLHVGDELHFVGESPWDTLPPSVIIYYIRKPIELSADTDLTIIPTQFIELILAYAEWHCALKAGLPPEEKRAAYNAMFDELRKSVDRDIEKKTPGVFQ